MLADERDNVLGVDTHRDEHVMAVVVTSAARKIDAMVIVGGTYGRLANRLTLFAHLAASAAEHGYRVWNPGFGDYAEYFPAFAGDALCRFPPRRSPFPARRATRHAAYALAWTLAALLRRTGIEGRRVHVLRLVEPDYLDLGDPAFVETARRRLVLVQGWLMRDPAALRSRADELRTLFRPAEPHLHAAAHAVEGARANADVVIGVHVRRGDYQIWEGGRYFWEPQRYAALMHHVERLFPDKRASFLVCSDALVSGSDFPGLPVTLGPGSEIGDLYALAGCDLLLGPPSTYSSWASFYGSVPLWMVRKPNEKPSLELFKVFDGGGVAAPAPGLEPGNRLDIRKILRRT